MKEKLTLQDLVDLLAKKAGLTKKEADAFFREFLALITENIFNNEPVKIKDFGTFKLTSVNSRESVNVNTGEKIEIPAHHKLSFLPDKSLKTLVNKPFEHFETELLNEEVTFEAIEISEEIDESSEFEDTAVDEPDFLNKSIISEPVDESQSEAEVEAIQETDIPEIGIITEQKADTPSFIYTYTEEKQHSGDDTITINVPSQQLIDEMTRAIENIKPTIAPRQTRYDEIENEEEEENNTFLGVNKVQEKIGQLKDAIDSLSQVSSQNLESANLQDSVEIKSESQESVEEGENKEKIEETREAQDKDLISNLASYTEPIEVQPGYEEESENSESDELQDDDSDYYNYNNNKNSLWSKIAHRLPIIIFLLVVIIAGVYLFSKLFEQRQIYDNFTSFQNLTEGDALPKATSEEESSDYRKFDRDPFDSDAIDEIQEYTDTQNNKISENLLDQKISENLSIGIVNKATYLLENKDSNNLTAPSSEKKDDRSERKTQANNVSYKQFPIKEEVITGSSLRSIAGRHYGNGAFWVYIYEENKDRLKGYDNLNIGQIITIPDLKKYNTSIDDPKAIEKAKELERKLFSERR